VAGQVKISGGSPGTGKVLTSDATGLASWQTLTSSPWQVSGSNIYYNNGNVGIGTNTPAALLNIYGTEVGEGNVVFVGEAKTDDYAEYGDPPVSGAGTRMMWYPDKAAFRAGMVSGVQWDNENVGFHSVAFGSGTRASGYISTALGGSTVASANFSSAMGRSTEASGDNSTAMGHETAASGSNSVAMGYETTASGYASTAMGRATTAPSAYETTIGAYSVSYTPASATNWNANDRLFVIGNGTSNTSRNNAITVLKNGNIGIGINNPVHKLVVVANSRIQLTKGNGAWIAMRTDGSLLDFSFSGHNLAIQGENDGENIVINPVRNSKVGIRTWMPMYTLDVVGDIRATGSVYYGGTSGSANGTAYTKPDYVFVETYRQLSTEEVDEYLKKEKHLPWITAADQEREENGDVVDMTRMAFETVETVENLQLQIIEMDKKIKALNEMIMLQQAQIEKLENLKR
jgi:DNA-directed RNA polymerase subunit H (RpoH/RPB5)